MNSHKIPPPAHLSKYIRFFWTLEFTDLANRDSVFQVFARKYPRMVFQHNDGHSGIYKGKDYLPLVYLGGLNTLPYDCGIHSCISAIGVSFFPHALRPIFGIDVCEIVNEMPDITNFGPSTLAEQLMDAENVGQKINILSDFFTRQLHKAVLPDKISEAGWRLLLHGTEESDVKKLTQIFNLSERQLQRRFRSYLGLTPKQYLQINRFEKAVDMLQAAGTNKLLDITYELGYTDQSHFIREFKQFSNQTPGEYLKLDKVYDESSAFIIKEDSCAYASA